MKYFQKQIIKKIKLIKNYILKSLEDLKKYIPKINSQRRNDRVYNFKRTFRYTLTLINNSNEKDGLEILNKLNPYIIKYYQTKSKGDLATKFRR